MPRNPTATAPHLCGPTVSFSTGTERAVMNKGAVKATAIASARGMNFNPQKNCSSARHMRIPRRRCAPGRDVFKPCPRASQSAMATGTSPKL